MQTLLRSDPTATTTRFERALPSHLAHAIDHLANTAFEPEPAPAARPARAPGAARPARAQRGERERDERRARAFKSASDYEQRALEKLSVKIRAQGGVTDRGLENISWFVWKMAVRCMGDATGEAARTYLRQLRSQRAAAAIYSAAFGGMARDGRVAPRHCWQSMRARRIVTFGLVLSALARPTKKGGPRSALVKGIGRGAFCAMLANPFDRRPSYTLFVKRTIKGQKEKQLVAEERKPAQPCIGAVFGVHRPGARDSATSSQVGYVHELKRAGFLYRLQRSAERSDQSELYGPSGHPPSQYWIMGLAALRDAPHELRWSMDAACSSSSIVCAIVDALQRARPPDD